MSVSVASAKRPKSLGTRNVSEQEFQSFVKASREKLANSDKPVHKLITPESDLRKMESVLEMEEGELSGDHVLYCDSDHAICACGRVPSFLDVIDSALKVHPVSMMASVLRGDMGYFVTNVVPPIFCTDCKSKIMVRGYGCKQYVC